MRRLAFLTLATACACAPPTLQQQLTNAEAKATRSERALDDVEAAYKKFEPDDAERALGVAKTAMADADFTYYPERAAIGERYETLLAKLPQEREAARLHRFEVKAAEHWADADKALLKLNSVLDTIGKDVPIEDEVDVAYDAATTLNNVLEDGESLESEVPKYHAYAQKGRLLLAKHLPRVLLDVARLKFVNSVPKEQAEGRENLARAKEAKVMGEKKDLYEDAAKAFSKCSEHGLKQVEDFNPLRTAWVTVPSGRTTAQTVITQCTQSAEASQKQVAVLEKELERIEKAAAKKAPVKKSLVKKAAPSKKPAATKKAVPSKKPR
jgi:hypothetical protein